MPYPSTLQEMIALATEGIRFQTWPYTLDLLPVEGMSDVSKSVGETRGALTSTLAILDGIRKGPYGLTIELQQLLSNIRFHVVNGIVLIDASVRMGHRPEEPRLVVDGLQAAIDNQVVAVSRARGAWATWLGDAHANKMQNDVLPPLPQQGFSGYGADAPSVPPAISAPVAAGVSLAYIAAAVGVLYLLSR